MSLPLFDKKRMATTIMERRNKDGSKGASADVAPEDGPSDGLSDLSVDLLQAIERKSTSEIASAFRAMFDYCEQEPHDEYGDESDEGQE